MKTIGLIGGMSWESTSLYYQIINREIGRRLGHLHSAPLHLISLDFEDIAARQRAADWPGLGRILAGAAQSLERGGADCVLIGTNTMHKVAGEVQSAISVPLLHIGDATACAVRAAGHDRIGLLGTRFTMEQPFYRSHLAERGIECVVPMQAQRNQVHHIIFDELCKGIVRAESRHVLQQVCAELAERGAQAIVLGCTELCLILGAADLALPVFDTTSLHAMAAVDFATATQPAEPEPAVQD